MNTLGSIIQTPSISVLINSIALFLVLIAKIRSFIDYRKDYSLFHYSNKNLTLGTCHFQIKILNFASVIKLDRHIEILLLENDCVIVPGLGGFVAHHVSARYDEQDGLFLPPYRTLGFNAQLRMNDSLLVQSYVDAYELSYPEALAQIEKEVDEIYQALDEEGLFELNDLGSLSRNSEGNLEFEPFESGILTPLYYGLSSFNFTKFVAEKQSAPTTIEVKTQKQGVVFVDDSDTANKRLSISMRAVRNVAAAAVFLTAVFLVAFPGSNRQGANDKQQIKSGVLYNIFDSDDTSNASQQLNTLTPTNQVSDVKLQQTTPTITSHYWAIVMASHVTESNARAFVHKLQKSGLSDARVYEGAESIKVLYGYFSSQKEAYEKMKFINKTTDFKEAWVIEIGK